MSNAKRWLRKIYASLPLKKPVYMVLRRCIRLPANVYRHLHFVAPITVTVQKNICFRMFHFGAQLENDLFWAGYGNGWEATSLRLWARVAAYSQTIFDVGSNTGVYALAAKAVNQKADVFAFEPVISIAEKLERNIALNGKKISVVRSAVSDVTGQAPIYIPSSEHSYSASLNSKMLNGAVELTETYVSTITLDDFVENGILSSVDLVKIDSEMHEAEILAGLVTTIARFRPALLVEVLNRDIGSRVELCIAESDYLFYEIVEGVMVRRVATLGGSSRNYFLCPRELAALNGFSDIMAHSSL